MTVPVLLLGFLRRDAAIGRSYRFAIVLELGSGAVFALFFFYLSRVVNDKSAVLHAVAAHGGYFPYVVVGISLIGVVDAALLGPANQLRADQVNGTLEPLLTTPAPAWLLVAAGSTYAVLKAIGLASGTLLFAVVVLGIQISGGIRGCLVAVVILVPAVVMLAGAGLLLAAATVVMRRAQRIAGFASVGIGFVCGVYYPVSVLPAAGRTLATILPPTWFFDLERAALLGGPIAFWKVSGLVAAAMLFPLAGAVGLGAALRRARRRGTLTHY